MPAVSPDNSSPNPLLARFRWLGGLGVLLVVLLAGCTPPPPPRAEKTVEVDVTTTIADEVLDYQDFTGRLDAFRTIEIRARVSGYVDEAPFKEGDLVHKGDVLFRIDARSFKADLAQAEGNLKLAIAERNMHDANASRARRLFSSRAIGQEEFEQMTANREKSAAGVLATEAARNRAALYLEYTSVISPVSGRISRRFIDPGNLVKADETLLTTVVADDTVYAYFDVDERTYLDLVGPSHTSASATSLTEMKFPVLMRLANEDDFTHPGHVDFLDNRLSGNTGTIRMRALFPNPRGVLKSGLFVRIRLPIGSFYRTLLIPDEALQSDQGRKFVYVVNSDNTVEYRTVKLGQSIHAMRVIKDGLKPTDRVVITGMQRVRPKMQVKANVQPPPNKPDFPLGKLMHQLQGKAPVEPKAPSAKPSGSVMRAPPAKVVPQRDASKGTGN